MRAYRPRNTITKITSVDNKIKDFRILKADANLEMCTIVVDMASDSYLANEFTNACKNGTKLFSRELGISHILGACEIYVSTASTCFSTKVSTFSLCLYHLDDNEMVERIDVDTKLSPEYISRIYETTKNRTEQCAYKILTGETMDTVDKCNDIGDNMNDINDKLNSVLMDRKSAKEIYAKYAVLEEINKQIKHLCKTKPGMYISKDRYDLIGDILKEKGYELTFIDSKTNQNFVWIQWG